MCSWEWSSVGEWARVLVMRGVMVQVMRVRGDAAGESRDMKDY